MNGIRHGDISFNNLMYDFLAGVGSPVGIVNDFDLATWIDHSATNKDRTGTIPFMAIDLLDGGLDRCTPRLYRHDMESFVWVLAYITVAKIEYKNRAIKISPLPKVDSWFRDGDQADRNVHVASKQSFHFHYGSTQPVAGRYHHYTDVIRQVIWYWDDFHRSSQTRANASRRLWPVPMPAEVPVVSEAEDNKPSVSLKLFLTTVEKSFREDDVQEGFAEMKSILLEAVETPTIAVQTV